MALPRDNFDSYTTGVDLNTLNSGSGWSGAWAFDAAGALTIETAPAGGQGGNAVRSIDALAKRYSRDFTPVDVGELTFRMRIDITNPSTFTGVILRDTAVGNRMYVAFRASGNIEILDNGVYRTVVSSYAVDTWYTIDIEWNNIQQPNKYRARANGGEWTPWYTVDPGTYTSIGRLVIADDSTNAHTFWLDHIADNYVAIGQTMGLGFHPGKNPTTARFYQSPKGYTYVPASPIRFRKTLSPVGSRTGSRQSHNS